MKKLLLVALLIVVVLAVACGGGTPAMSSQAPNGALGGRDSSYPYPAAAPTAAPAPAMPAQPPAVTEEKGGTSASGGIPSAPGAAGVERMVVYNGTIRLEVQDTEQTIAKIEDILKSSQGYISSRSIDQTGSGKASGTVTIRVPVGSMPSVLDQIRKLGLKVLHEDGNSQDVTQEYVDLDARRKNLEAYEQELTKLLETVRERTGKAEDILAVYNQLTEVRGQIEQIKGRQNYLENTSSLATYTIALIPHEEVQVIEEGWSPATTAQRALKNLVQIMQGLADVGIYVLITVVPVLAVIALPFVALFLIARALWRSRRPRKAAAA